MKYKVLSVLGVFLCLLFVGACGPKAASKAKAEAIASSTPNAAAKAKVEADINACITPTTLLLSSNGRAKAQACLNKKFTPAQKQKLEDCLLTAAEKDHIFTKHGRTIFESTSVGYCAGLVA